MVFQLEKVEFWQNNNGDTIRRTMVNAPDRPPTRVVDNLSLRQKAWSFGGWAEKVPAYDPRYGESYAAKEAAKFTDTPFERMRDLLAQHQIFRYEKKTEIPLTGVIIIGENATISSRVIRRPHFDTRLSIWFTARNLFRDRTKPWEGYHWARIKKKALRVSTPNISD